MPSVVLRTISLFCVLQVVQGLLQLQGEGVVGKGLENIVEGVDIVAVDSKLGRLGDEHDGDILVGLADFLCDIDAVVFLGEDDVQKDEIVELEVQLEEFVGIRKGGYFIAVSGLLEEALDHRDHRLFLFLFVL